MGISLQPQAQVLTAYGTETTFGTIATNDSTAKIFRTTSGQGLKLSKAPIASEEVRSDLQRQRDRHGAQSVTGTLGGELSLGTFDDLLQASMRSTWSAPLTSGAFSFSYDPATGVITRATGGFLSEGFRIGDTVTLVGAGSNSGIPVTLTAVSAATCTVGNRLALGTASTVAGVTMVRPKKLVTGTTRRSFSVEHWQPAITNSERFLGCRASGFTLNVPASGPIGIEFAFTGRSLVTNTARYFTSAVNTTSLQMASPDAVIIYNGTQAATVTALTLALTNNHTVPPVAGSTLSPDVIEGAGQVTGSVTMYVTSQAQLNAFVNETGPLSLQVMCRELATAGFITFGVQNFTLGDYTTERIGQGDAQLVTFPLLVGVATDAQSDASMLTICASNA
jgi:hypothetical protein